MQHMILVAKPTIAENKLPAHRVPIVVAWTVKKKPSLCVLVKTAWRHCLSDTSVKPGIIDLNCFFT